MERDDSFVCSSWDDGRGSAPGEVQDCERPLEIAVSAVIREMPFLWLPIEDTPGPDSLRGSIERNAIALLSNYQRTPLDPPSDSWLGHHCNRERVRLSGLWNSEHVDTTYEPAFLETLDGLVERVGSRSC